MAPRSLFARFLEAFGRSKRYDHFFSMSDRELATHGFDRAGLARCYVAELSGR